MVAQRLIAETFELKFEIWQAFLQPFLVGPSLNLPSNAEEAYYTYIFMLLLHVTPGTNFLLKFSKRLSVAA